MLVPNGDSPSVKNTDTAGDRGFDGGPNVKGIKRHAGVASLGLPQVIQVTKAFVTEREAALEMFQLHSDSWPAVETVLADGGLRHSGGPRSTWPTVRNFTPLQ